MAFNTIMQFILQTAGIALLAILLQPILNIIAFDPSLWAHTTAENQARRDALYQWSLVIPTVAMGANVVWLYRAVQRNETTYEDL
ncbi:MAG: hypothetical protein ABI337_01615 [Nitrososphaera sp.]|jgi:hypothetical protein